MRNVRRISNKYYIRQIMACFLSTCLFFGPAVYAGPENPSVAQGPVTFQQVGNTWNITQDTANAIVNYSKFNVGSSEIINFLHSNPGFTDFAILNRILSASPTNIDGQINSLGRVFFVNPAGIVFGDNARINVAQMVASGLEISDNDFLAGNYIFKDGWYSHRAGNGWHYNYYGGNINVNGGAELKASQIMLVGKSVFNDGTLTKRDIDSSTYVIMGAGDTVKFFQQGSDVIIEAANPADRKIVNNGNINTNGGDVLLGAGDIYTKAIGNLDTLTAKSLGDITVDGAIETTGDTALYAYDDIVANASINATGDITLWADYDGDAIGNMYAGYDGHTITDVPITAGGNIVIRGNDVRLGGAVTATGGDLTITGRDCDGDHGTKWGDIWAYSTLNAGGDIVISDTGKTEEDVWVVDGCRWCGWKWVEDGHWEHVTTYQPGTINLYDNVTAGGNLMLCNKTETYNSTGNGVRLQAGENVILAANENAGNNERDNCTYLHGRDNLEIVALGGMITNESAVFDGYAPTTDVVPWTTISVEGSSLLMQQLPSIDTKNYVFANQNTTDLALISTGGSVTSDLANADNAADEWASIGATANNNITLTGDDEIRLATLEATLGDITVETSKGDVVGSGNITAHQGAVSITSTDDDVILGSLSSPIDVTAGSNLTLTADGDVWAYGNLSSTSTGNVEIFSSPDTTYLGGNVSTANGDIIFHNNVEAIGADGQTFDADGWGSDLIAYGYISKTTDGDFTLDAGRGWDAKIKLYGNVDTANGNLTFGDKVIAKGDGTQTFAAGGWGKDLIARDDIIKVTDGDLILEAGWCGAKISLGGDVKTCNGNLIFKDDVIADGVWCNRNQRFDAGGWGSDLRAYGDIKKTTCGDLTLDAGRGCDAKIYLYGDVQTKNGNLTFEDKVIAKGWGNQEFNADGYGKVLYAWDDIIKTTKGDLTLDGGYVPDGDGYAINLAGNVIVTGGDGWCQGGDLILGDKHHYDNTTVAPDKKLVAVHGNVEVYGALNGEGNLDVKAGKDVELHDYAQAYGNLTIIADTDKSDRHSGDVYADGDLRAYGGDLTIDAAENTIYLGGDAYATGNIWLMANTKLNGWGDQELTADGSIRG